MRQTRDDFVNCLSSITRLMRHSSLYIWSGIDRLILWELIRHGKIKRSHRHTNFIDNILSNKIVHPSHRYVPIIGSKIISISISDDILSMLSTQFIFDSSIGKNTVKQYRKASYILKWNFRNIGNTLQIFKDSFDIVLSSLLIDLNTYSVLLFYALLISNKPLGLDSL